MKMLIIRAREHIGLVKLWTLVVSIFLAGALAAHGAAAWYYNSRMEAQSKRHNDQIVSLTVLLDENAKTTVARLASISERMDYVVQEIKTLVGKSQQTVQKADEAAERAQEAAQAAKEVSQGATP